MLLVLFFALFCSAQTPPVESPVSVTFKDGIRFATETPLVDVRLRFRMQNRFTFSDYDSADSSKVDTADFMIRRLRLRLDGSLIDPRFGFNLQLAFSRLDIDWDTVPYPSLLRDATMYWKWSPTDITYFGLRKLPTNRQLITSSQQLEMIDRSLASATFTLDRDIGIQSWHRFFEERPLWLKVAVTNGEGRSVQGARAGLSYTARTEWLPFGDFKNNGDYFEGDLEYETDAKVSMAAVYNINHQVQRLGGQTGAILTDNKEARHVESFMADFLLKYRGWALSTEFFRRIADRPVISSTQTIYNGFGREVQMSYTFANRWAPVARWAQITPDDGLKNLLAQKNQYTVGVTKYFDHHRLKAQFDTTWEQEKAAGKTDFYNHFIYRFQIEMGI